MSERTPSSELEILRVSIARLAQNMGLGDDIPGIDSGVDPSLNDLCASARGTDRGWNDLVARMIDTVQEHDAQLRLLTFGDSS